MSHTISSDALTRKVAALFEKCGSTASEAPWTARPRMMTLRLVPNRLISEPTAAKPSISISILRRP